MISVISCEPKTSEGHKCAVMGKMNTGGNACVIPVEKIMERDCGLGQGAARFVKDRLAICSDEYKMWVCDICGLPAHIEKKGQIRECRLCGVGADRISKVRVPYGTKIVNQETMAMNMVPRIMTTAYDENDMNEEGDE
jgi:hypothetical protein